MAPPRKTPLPTQPPAEAPQVPQEAFEPTSPGVEGVIPSEAPQTASEEEVAAQAPEETPEQPRPFRVETFASAEDEWTWRLCDATGTVVAEGTDVQTTRLQAVRSAKQDDRTEGATFLDEHQPR